MFQKDQLDDLKEAIATVQFWVDMWADEQAEIEDPCQSDREERKVILAVRKLLKVATSSIQPPAPTTYQERVILEKQTLDGNITKLRKFIYKNPAFKKLPGKERTRMRDQLAAMRALSNILGERIAAFE